MTVYIFIMGISIPGKIVFILKTNVDNSTNVLINILCAKLFWINIKINLHFLSFLVLRSKGGWYPCLQKTRSHGPCTVNTMAADDLVRQGTRSSASLVLTQLWVARASASLVLTQLWVTRSSASLVLTKLWVARASASLVLTQLWVTRSSASLILTQLWVTRSSASLVLTQLWVMYTKPQFTLCGALCWPASWQDKYNKFNIQHPRIQTTTHRSHGVSKTFHFTSLNTMNPEQNNHHLPIFFSNMFISLV